MKKKMSFNHEVKKKKNEDQESRVYYRRYGGAHGVIVIVVGNRHGEATRVQIQDDTISISHSTNTLGKCMNPIILPPAMGK